MTVAVPQSRIPTSALQLGLAGLIPFVAAALSLWVPLPGLEPAQGLRLGLAYGAVILSFLGGVRWGAALRPLSERRQAVEFAVSVLPSLAGWLALLLPDIPALCLLIVGFLLQALWDVTSVETGKLPSWFGRLRMLLTAGAVLSLVAMLAAILI